MVPGIVRSGISLFFEYDTPRIVHIKSKKVGIINRLLQLLIIGYVIGYAIVYKKGYQETDTLQGAVTTKVKGVARTFNLTKDPPHSRIWDVSDYVVPPQENNAFFVITNLIVTPFQAQGLCEEDLSISGANCTDDPSVCVEGEPLLVGDGYMTGECLNSTRQPGMRACQVQAWCPTEDGSIKAPSPPALLSTQNFTVFIKNNIEFPKFAVKRNNVPQFTNETYLKNCRFDFGVNSHCPIFQLNSIVGGAGTSNYEALAYKGGVIQIIINWDCNLDYNANDCVPEYEFRRLDSDQDFLSKGYNFRYSRYYKDENQTEYRTLFKAYGIKFVITVQGTAGKFNLVPLMTNIGSGLALLGIATVLSDCLVLYVLKAKSLYREKKYLQVVGDDAYKDDETSPVNSPTVTSSTEMNRKGYQTLDEYS